jgi:putative transposase
MARIARIAVEGVPYHLTQRGNGKQRVFFADADYRMYLDLLRRYSGAHALDVWAYCLMPNHVHLIVVPKRESSMAKALGRTQAEYAKYFNLVQRSCGHVWQARYFSCPLDGAHLGGAMAYVERNPVRAGLVEDALTYRWSSHFGTSDPAGIVRPEAWQQDYPALDDEQTAEQIRAATRLGRPLGQPAFIEKLEANTGRRLRPKPTRDSTLSPQPQAPLFSFEPDTGD